MVQETLNSNLFYLGSSTGVKPSPELAGATFWEHDTKDTYKWTSTGWVQVEEGQGITVIDYGDSLNKQGKAFSANYYWTAGIDEAQDFYYVSPSTAGTRAYFKVDITSLGETEYQVWTNPVTSSTGTNIPLRNYDGNSGTTAASQLLRDPTIINTGPNPVAYQERWGSGAKEGGSAKNRDARIILTGLKFLLRVVSRANGNYTTLELNVKEETQP